MTEYISQLGNRSLSIFVRTTILLNGETSYFVLGAQITELLASDFRIRTTVTIIVGVITITVFVFIFVFVFVSQIFFAEARSRCEWRSVRRRRSRWDR